ncbi:hypothetical protein [Bacillus sp. N1-1]|nr:hypothetical protein [Bacillus sp. N1-1]
MKLRQMGEEKPEEELMGKRKSSSAVGNIVMNDATTFSIAIPKTFIHGF